MDEDDDSGGGRFIANPEGPTTVRMTSAQGSVEEFVFEGAFLITGVTSAGTKKGSAVAAVGSMEGLLLSVAAALANFSRDFDIPLQYMLATVASDAFLLNEHKLMHVQRQSTHEITAEGRVELTPEMAKLVIGGTGEDDDEDVN